MDSKTVADIEDLLSNGISCLAHTCYNSRILKPELVYYKLPKEEKLCQTWLKNAGRLDLLQMPLNVVQRNYYLCERHFEKKWFRKPEWKASLNYYQNPVPTIFKNNIKSFPSEVIQEAYEAKKKREEFMRTFPGYEESNISEDETEENEVYEDELKEEPSSDAEMEDDETMELERNIKSYNEAELEPLEEGYFFEDENKPDPCRFCTLPAGEDGKYIFSEDEESKKIQEMVNVILPAQVHENDGLPHHMCLLCIEKLKHCYETILAYFAAEAFFRSQEIKEENTSNGNLSIDDVDDDNDDGNNYAENLEDNFQKNLMEASEASFQYDLGNDDPECLQNVDNEVDVENNSTSKSGSFKCGLCFDECPSLQDLVSHRKIYHPSSIMKKRYYCLKCPMIFMRAKTLHSHMQSIHPPEEKDYPCDDCDKVFKLKYLLNSHRKLMHKKHVCNVCEESFYYPALLKRHMRTHDDSAKCSVCDKEFKNAYWRRIHEKSHSLEGCHLCWVCGKVFHLRTSLHTHLQSHTDKYKCDLCDKSIATLSGLRKHQLLHRERVKNYKCTTCEKAFFSNQLLKQHSLSHTGARPHVCHCGAAFNRLSNLNYHKKRHLETKTKQPQVTDPSGDNEVYKCDLCNKEVVSKLTFKYHVARHTGNKKPFDCEECGLTFSTTYSYKTHFRIHTGERPFVCKVENCGLGFRSKSTLQQHEIVHVEDRPFVCPICPVSFKRLYSLNMHKTTHSALRPYQCNVCERAFARKPDARIHVMRQHGIPGSEVYEYLQEVVTNDGSNDELTFPYIVEEELSESTILDDDSEDRKTDYAETNVTSPLMYRVILS